MRKTKLKLKKLNLIILIINIICLITFIISLSHILKWQKDSRNTNKQIKDIQNIVKIEVENNETQNEDTQNEEIILPQKEVLKFNPYWDYIKMNLLDVDFTNLKKINNDTVGWIKVNGTNINYPFVKTSNNTFYLKHSFDKSYNRAGWVFADYRNKLDSTDKNTILYAHGRTDKTMFGSLKYTLNKSWYNNLKNHIVKLSTEHENTLWQIVSIYHIPTTSDYIEISFLNDEDFILFSNMIIKRSLYNFNTNINPNDQILTLSTCYNSKEKLVLHAKLIKRETK